ncbi:Uncharacterised protein [Candidatus Gugararchaeum adminiculabundum]|nr:Uncharacterised protein [Candidatus Gugararchaeum adminiculabundum]
MKQINNGNARGAAGGKNSVVEIPLAVISKNPFEECRIFKFNLEERRFDQVPGIDAKALKKNIPFNTALAAEIKKRLKAGENLKAAVYENFVASGSGNDVTQWDGVGWKALMNLNDPEKVESVFARLMTEGTVSFSKNVVYEAIACIREGKLLGENTDSKLGSILKEAGVKQRELSAELTWEKRIELCDALEKTLKDRLGKLYAIKDEPVKIDEEAVGKVRGNIGKITSMLGMNGKGEKDINALKKELSRQQKKLGHLLEGDDAQRKRESLIYRKVLEIGEVIEKKIGSVRIQEGLEKITGTPAAEALRNPSVFAMYADEIAALLGKNIRPNNREMEGLQYIRGKGAECALAPRDETYLTLGDKTGDSTAKNPAKREEGKEPLNSHWTVYTWLLDPMYSILNVYIDGEFVMKAHLRPMSTADRPFLSVDAIETIPEMRDNLKNTDFASQRLLSRKEEAFGEMMRETRRIARRAGIKKVFAEIHSNTGWVQEKLTNGFEPNFPDSELISPVGGLEHVYHLAVKLMGEEKVGELLMELQTQNPKLEPEPYARQTIKRMAVLMGQSDSPLGWGLNTSGP